MMGAAKKLLRKMSWHRSLEGPYRFYTRRLQEIDDINLVARVLGTDVFRGSLEPVPLPIERFATYLVLAPHQDDEAIGAGGLLCRLKKEGASAHVVFLTDGRQVNHPGVTADAVVRQRHDEAEKALSMVDAHLHELGINNLTMAIDDTHVRGLSALIDDIDPEVILLPWLFDAPVKHRVASHLLYLAHQTAGIKAKEIWGYQVHSEIFPNGYVDITGEIDDKLRMIECHAGQMKNIQAYGHIARGMAAWNARHLKPDVGEVSERYLEMFFSLPTAAFLEYVETFYLPALNRVYKGDEALARRMANLGAVSRRSTDT